MNRKTILKVLSLTISCLTTINATSQTNASCNPKGVAAGFFNGVLNTTVQAGIGKTALARAIGTKTASGEDIQWDVFYNTSNTMWADMVETFNQRTSTEDLVFQEHWELFWEFIQSGAPSGWSGTIVKAGPTLFGFLVDLGNAFRAKAIAALTFTLKNPPTLNNYSEHRAKIDSDAITGKKMFFVAHSQGNLFAVPAYEYAISKVGAQAVKVIHIAPASQKLVGDYTLADRDFVINALRAVGSVPPNNVTIPATELRSVYTDEKGNDYSDGSGHMLIETYLEILSNPRAKIQSDSTSALNSLQPSIVGAQSAACNGFTKIASDGSVLPSDASTWSCVRQNSTGLLWEARVLREWSLFGYPNYGDRRTYDASAVGVSAGIQCGVAGWRLPTVEEGRTLFAETAYVLDPTLAYETWFKFQDTVEGGQYIWTSSAVPGRTQTVYVLELKKGVIQSALNFGPAAYTRLVH